eukprot:4535641-Pleurochrysis_carterae.AAC.1
MSSLTLSWRCFQFAVSILLGVTASGAFTPAGAQASPAFDQSIRPSRTRHATDLRAQRRTAQRTELCRQTPSTFCGGLPGPRVSTHVLAFRTSVAELA